MNDSEKKWLCFHYAWNWFEYHAAQRLTAFRFYLIIIGAVGWIFSQKELNILSGKEYLLLGLSAIFISLLFFLLDVRNEHLVNRGRYALDEIEKELGLLDTPYAIRHHDNKNRVCCVSHSFVIRAFYLIILATGLIFVGVSFCK